MRNEANGHMYSQLICNRDRDYHSLSLRPKKRTIDSLNRPDEPNRLCVFPALWGELFGLNYNLYWCSGVKSSGGYETITGQNELSLNPPHKPRAAFVACDCVPQEIEHH